MVDLNFKSEDINIVFNFYIEKDTDLEFTDSNLTTGIIDYDFEFNSGIKIFNILINEDNVFNTIWCDPKASLKNNTFYVTTKNSLNVIKTINSQATLYDYYSQNVVGRAQEALMVDDLVDLIVTY